MFVRVLILSFPNIGCSLRQIAAPILGVAIFACTDSAVSQGENAEQGTKVPTAAEVQEKLRQWVRTRQLISEERADWDAEQQALADLNDLREQEVERLDELIEAAGSRLTDAGEEACQVDR